MGNDATSPPSSPDANAYYTNLGFHGGAGATVSEDKVNTSATGTLSGGGSTVEDDCEVTMTMPENFDVAVAYANTGSTGGGDYDIELYNEYGELVGSLVLTVGPNDTQTATGAYTFRIAKGDQIVLEEIVGGTPNDLRNLVEIINSSGTVIAAPT